MNLSRMIRKTRALPFLLFLVALAPSCLEEIDLTTGERILNVYCILQEGPLQELELSYITPTGGTIPAIGEDVNIRLFEQGVPVGNFSRISDREWTLDYSPVHGRTYRLEVDVPGEKSLSAETKFPPKSVLRDVYIPLNLPGVTSYARVYELKADEDQVLWCFFQNQLDGKALSDYIATDHPGLDPRGETIYPLDISSSIWDHAFYYSGSQCYFKEHPFLHEHVVRIQHPAGFCQPDTPVTKYYLDENHQELSHETGQADLFSLNGVNTDSGMRSDLVIYSVSAEYDAYLADYFFMRRDTGDFASSVYQRNHYSNILHGTGIFGAFCEHRRNNLHINMNPYNMLY